MPAISPQGSRTGLVTALVIFVILFVTSTILFIYENAERRSLQERVQQLGTEKGDLVSDPAMTSPDVVKLIEDAKAANPPSTALEMALAQRREMAKLMTGQELAPDRAKVVVQEAIARATAKDVTDANVRIAPTNGLTQVVATLASGVGALQQERTNLQNQLKAANDEKNQVIAGRDAMLRAKEQQIAEIRNTMTEAEAQLVVYRQSNQSKVQGLERTTVAALNQHQASNEKLSSQLAQANETIGKKDREIEELTRRLNGIRVPHVEATIQREDGEITRVPNMTTVIINRGSGDQIVRGMTFEVYDRQSGIPALGDGMRPDEMPEGKASIEVIRTGPGYSECRVIRRKPGYGLIIGDLISNLVYDSTQKYNFVVYGDFDLNNDGRAESGDADVIKRLITAWGGAVVNDVNVSTDFVVMGVEPTAEPILANDDALVIQQKTEALQAQDRYQEVLKKANDLNIPIMNQNRFLNFVGYASQATR